MTNKIIFITFGGPTENYHRCVNRLCNEAKNFNIFDEIYGLTDIDLKNDISFWNKHGDFIEKNRRGYGYWIWKSYINIKLLEKINENDIVIYADSGCTLNNNPNSFNKLNEYITMAKNSHYGIVSFKLGSLEKQYTKMDLFHSLDCIQYLDTKQLMATVFIYKKCNHTIFLFNKAYEISSEYHLINDNPSHLLNDRTFVDHRHDQSIFSLLRKKYGTEIIENDETYFNDFEKDGINYPIWATRKRY